MQVHRSSFGIRFWHRRMVSMFLVIVCLLHVYPQAQAQVATYYTFSQSLQAYKSDTSTTSTVPASIFSTGWDDNTYTAYKFPFNFTYNGVLYTGGVSTIGLDTDGWMAFSTTGTITMTGTTAGGSWVSASNSTGVYLNGTANNNGICGFNSDLEEQDFTTITGNITTGSPLVTGISSLIDIRVGMRISGTGIPDGTVINSINTTTSTIRLSANATATTAGVTLTPRTSIYAFIRGIAPYRQFVIQWTRATRFNYPGDDFTFQIVLNEGGGNANYQTLQAVYGICKATNTTAQNAQVGLRGASAADYNARKTTTNWSATTAATANTDVCTLTPSVFPATGLTYTWSPACLAVPSNAGSISGPVNVCPGTIVDYSIPGVPGAIFYNWTYTGTGVTLAGTSTLPTVSLDFGLLATGGTLTVTPGNLCGSGASSSVVISINALPSASISYPSSAYCTSSSVVNVTQTGPGGGTYSASPAGLSINATTGQVTPSTSTPGSYTITYSYVSGCAGTATTTMLVGTGPTVTTSATPSSVCSGQNAQLLASAVGSGNYTYNSIAYSALTPSGSPTVLYSTYTLDAISAAQTMPFTFSFYGQNITQFYVSTEGYVQLQTGTAVSWTPQFLPNATDPNNIIAMAWDDLIVDPTTNAGSSVRYFVNGTSPNRVLVIDYVNLRYLGGTGAQKATGQIRLYEVDNHIEVALTNINDNGTSRTKTLGIENNTGSLGLSPVGRNLAVWNTSNEAWAFYPPAGSYTYSWSPSTFLSSTSIANPVATAVTATTNYTVTVTNTSTGCSSTANLSVPLGNVGATGSITGVNPACPGTTQSYSIPAVTNATAYNWTYSGSGVTLTATTASPSNSLVFGPSATGGTLTVTPSNACGSGSPSNLSITVTSVATATISYPLPTYCSNASGSVSVTRTGPAGGAYSTSPATGLTINTSTGAITPSSSTAGTYTVIYTYNSGSCSSITATTTVTISVPPTVTASASPATICTGGSSQLNAIASSSSNYTVSSIAHNSLAPSGSPTILWNTTTDDGISSAIPIPFSFNFYGNAITQFYVSTNGHIQLQNSSGASNTEQTLPTAATPNNVIALSWDDLVVDPTSNPGSLVRYFMNGTAPNRIMVIDYVSLRFYLGSGQTVTGQIRLYESDNHIEVAATTVNDNGTSRTKTLGIENSTGTLGLSPAGRNNIVWNTSNEAWAFYPPPSVFTYAWSPATYLSNTAISNPLATAVGSTTAYTVTATNTSTGCTATANVTLTATAPLNGTYTVGVSGNFSTLTAAINAYNTQCIGGPVVFSLIDATYSTSETFPIVIKRNSYASAVNTLTIRPASSVTATITGSVNSNAMIKIIGKYVTIDGSNNGTNTRNLTITNTNNNSAVVVHIGSSGTTAVQNVTIKNCNLVDGTNNDLSYTSAVSVSDSSVIGSAGYFNNITIQNNNIKKGEYGIDVIAVKTTGNGSGTVISQNLLNSTAGNAIGEGGIYLEGVDGALISQNNVGNFNATIGEVDYAVWVALGCRNVTVDKNNIHDIRYTGTSGYAGQGLLVSTGETNANVTVSNNMFYAIIGDADSYVTFGAAYSPVAIYLFGSSPASQTGINIYYNTIFMDGLTLNKTNALSIGIAIEDNNTATLKNNIIHNKLGRSGTLGIGTVCIALENSASQLLNSNYNNYYCNPGGSGASLIGRIGATNYTTLATWQAAIGQEANAKNILPVYVSSSDLHLNPSSNATLSNAGTPVSGVSDDYDAQTRNGLTPDIGCDEWIEPNKGSWVGLVSTDWMNAANWESNFIPTSTTDVTITGGYTFMPTLSVDTTIRNLSLSAPGAPSNIPLLTLNNAALKVLGTITRTGGSINGSNGTLAMNGSGPQSIPASLFQNNNLKHLIIGNTNGVTGVTLDGTLDIYGSVTFSAAGQRLTTNDNLTFKSNLAGTAWLGNVTGKVINGKATVERYISTGVSHGKGWQFVSVPLKGTQTINQAWQDTATSVNQNRYSGYGTQLVSNISPLPSLFDAAGSGPSLKTYNPASNAWDGVLNTTSTAISNKKGYMVFVRGDRSVTTVNGSAVPTVLRAKGTLYTTGADLPPSTTVLANKYETIGNPYASAIDFLTINKPPAAQVDDAFYVWDPLRYGLWGYGAFQTISSSNGYKPIPGGTANYTTGVTKTRIESGQAFAVHATGPSSGGSISFTETAKLSGSQTVFRQPSQRLQDRQFINCSLYGISSTFMYLADANVVAIDEQFDAAYDHEDALKMPNPGENFGIRIDTATVALEARKPVQASDTVHYWLTNLRRQQYQFRFFPEKMEQVNHAAFLYDRFRQLYIPVSLTDSTQVDFEVNDQPGSSAPNRFILVFKPVQTVPVTFTGISATRKDSRHAELMFAVENELQIQHYEIQRSVNGRDFNRIADMSPGNNQGGAAEYLYADNGVNEGIFFYRVKAISRDGREQFSKIANIAPVHDQSIFSIYPNPVTNGLIQIYASNKPSGNYAVQVINAGGQIVWQDQINVQATQDRFDIKPAINLASGQYQVRILPGSGEPTVLSIQVK